MNQTIYIDGVKRHCTPLYSSYAVCTFFVDSDAMPHTHCAQHTLSGVAVEHMRAGGVITTSEHRYSLSPPVVEPVPAQRPTTIRRHLALWWHVYTAVAVWLLAVFVMSLVTP